MFKSELSNELLEQLSPLERKFLVSWEKLEKSEEFQLAFLISKMKQNSKNNLSHYSTSEHIKINYELENIFTIEISKKERNENSIGYQFLTFDKDSINFQEVGKSNVFQKYMSRYRGLSEQKLVKTSMMEQWGTI